MGGNFREKLEEAFRIKFRGFKFCGATLNSVHARDANFGFDRRNAWPDSRRKESGYARLEERWSASVSSLAWEATTSTKHELRWCSHT